MSAKWLILGSSGQVGTELIKICENKELDYCALGRNELDITNFQNVMNCMSELRPKYVVNCAAWTAVDAAEEFRDKAFSTNVLGPKNIAKSCVKFGSILFQISTNYVFEGNTNSINNEFSKKNPINYYGLSKLNGEEMALRYNPNATIIIRSASIYGLNGKNFALTILENISKQKLLKVIEDQFVQPTWSKDLADRIITLAKNEISTGTYHAVNSGSTNWYVFAKKLISKLQLDNRYLSKSVMSDLNFVAPRPVAAIMQQNEWQKIGFNSLPSWEDALDRASAEMKGLVF